jgi:hypothetical protein
VAVFYLHHWQHPSAEAHHAYQLIQQRFLAGIKRVVLDDPRAAWSMPRMITAVEDTGHAPLQKRYERELDHRYQASETQKSVQ